MGNQILRTAGTQICFANHSGDFAPSGVYNLQQGTPSEVQINLDAIADTEARESDKCDLGASRAPAYSVMAAIGFSTAPTAGDYVEFYWGSTPDPTAGNANPGGLSGSDADYDGYDGTDLADAVKQLDYIGNLSLSDQSNTLQIGKVATFSPSERYGVLVVKNEGAQAFDSYTSQMHVMFTPIIDEVE